MNSESQGICLVAYWYVLVISQYCRDCRTLDNYYMYVQNVNNTSYLSNSSAKVLWKTSVIGIGVDILVQTISRQGMDVLVWRLDQGHQRKGQCVRMCSPYASIFYLNVFCDKTVFVIYTSLNALSIKFGHSLSLHNVHITE